MSVHNGNGKFGGRDYSSDVRPSYILYFVLRVRDNKRMHSRSGAEENAIRKQQLATEADTIGKQQAEAGAIGEQQLKQTQCTVLGAAAGADTIGVLFGLTTQD